MVKCSSCGTVLKDGMKFCRKCGKPITEEAHEIRNISIAKKEEKRAEESKKTVKIVLIVACVAIGYYCLSGIMSSFISRGNTISDKQIKKQSEELMYEASKAECVSYEGEITEEKLDAEYIFTASVEGVYGIEWIVPRDDETRAHISVYDENEKKLTGILATTRRERERVGKLNPGDKIQIVVEGKKYDEGRYKINVWRPKDVVNLTGYTAVNDSIDFRDQINTYNYTAQDNKLAIGGKVDNGRVTVSIYEKNDKKIESFSIYESTSSESVTVVDGIKEGDELLITVEGDRMEDEIPYKLYIQ